MEERLKILMETHGLHTYITQDCQNRMEMLAKLLEQEHQKKIEDLELTIGRLSFKNRKLKAYISEMVDTGREALEPER